MGSLNIWFWQRIVTPHMTALATRLALQGCEVTYVAELPMSEDRVEQGWTVPDLPGVRQLLAPTVDSISTLIASAPRDSLHICQGLRGNGLVRHAQDLIKMRGLQHWVVMETVDDAGLRGAIKRLVYRYLFTQWRMHLRGVLAIGQSTPEWVVSRGMPATRVFPFAYFLGDSYPEVGSSYDTRQRFRFLFVGSFIEIKRIDMLLNALHQIHTNGFEMAIVGSGPMEALLKTMSERLLPGRVYWVGRLSISQVPAEIVKADCLVLPSRHDGWGAVISEALLVGTPVICSSACGAATVVRASGKGGVFKSGDRRDLIVNLKQVLSKGLVQETDRATLANWASCLGAKAGASYLLDILKYDDVTGEKPSAPWMQARYALRPSQQPGSGLTDA